MKLKPKIPTTIHDTKLIISMARRRGQRLESTSHEGSSSSEHLESNSREIDGKMSREVSSDSHPIKGRPLEIPYDDPEKPSTDLRWKPKGIIRRLIYLPGRIKRFWHIFVPPLTEEEEAGREELKKLNRIVKLVKREARQYARMVSNKLAQLGEKEILLSPGAEHIRKLKQVKFDMATWDLLFTKIVLSVRIDPKHLPAYVSVSKLAMDPLYALDIAPSLNHDVKWECDNAGVRITVYRHGKDGLPEFVSTETMWKRCPANKPPLTVPVGFGDNSATYFIDPAEYPHLLITGGTGWGKSNMVNQLICFWLARGITPEDLQLVMFDLKKGMEFANYENLPHLYKDDVVKTGIIETLDEVMPTMRRMQEIRDLRMEKIKRAGYKNFEEYNWGSRHEDKLPTIFLVFDEWAKIRLSRTSGFGPKSSSPTLAKLSKETVESILRKGVGMDSEKLLEAQTEFASQVLKLRQARHFGLEAEDMLAEFTNLSRAAGMYVILSTQHPSKAVLSGLILTNFPTRIVLNCSVGGSMAALATQAAFGLEFKGRAILLDRGQEIKVQTPMISDGDIKDIVEKVISGEPMGNLGRLGTGIEEIMIYSLHNLDGTLDILKLFEIFRKKGVRKKWLIDSIRSLEGKEVSLSGARYKVSLSGNHRIARHLIRL